MTEPTVQDLTFRGIPVQQLSACPGVPTSDLGEGTLERVQDAVNELATAGGDPDGLKTLTAATGVTAAEYGGMIKKSVLTLDEVPITIDGSGGVGWGTALLATFPVGIVQIHAIAVTDLILNRITGVDADAAGNFSVGSAATSDSTLSGTDANMVASTAIANVANAVDAAGVAGLGLDGTASAATINLNMNIADADVGSSTYACTLDGKVTVIWSYVGNDA